MSLELLTVDEAAGYLQTTAKALYSQRERGAAPGNLGVMIGRRLRFDRGDLDAWFRSQQPPNGDDPAEARSSTGTTRTAPAEAISRANSPRDTEST